MIIAGVGETLYMTLFSTFFGYVFGMPLGILLKVSDKEGLRPNAVLYKILDVIANIFRSIPFLILLILLIPFTRFLVGKSYGTTATIVPLTIAAIPFIGRMVESSLNEVDPGVIEAARSMGASNLQIVFRVMLVEARTSLISGATIVTGTILGYSAMAGTVGGGGLGDIAVRYGYNRWQTDIMLVTVILLVVLVQIFQTIGMLIANKLDKRNKSKNDCNVETKYIFQKIRRNFIMKKLIAAALTGALVLGTVGTSVVFAADDDKTITVAASETPHSEILEAAKPILEEEGYDLEVTVFDDYVQPNEVVESGDFDANYFQHIPYLNSFNEEKGTHLVNAGGIHYEPFGIYPGTKSSLDDIADGDTIAVPNDTTNEARALLLLQDNGIIKLKDGAGLEATVNDIEENPYNVEIVELAAEQVARVAEETSYIVLNGNYALQAGYSVSKDALAYETSDSEAAKTYVNVIAVKEGNENSDKIKALVDVLKSDEIKDFINEKYDGAVIPFEDSDDAETGDAEAADDADETAAAEADTADETAEETDAE